MSHLIKFYTVCPLVFEFSVWYSLDLPFFEKLRMKILSSAFLVVKELMAIVDKLAEKTIGDYYRQWNSFHKRLFCKKIGFYVYIDCLGL